VTFPVGTATLTGYLGNGSRLWYQLWVLSSIDKYAHLFKYIEIIEIKYINYLEPVMYYNCDVTIAKRQTKQKLHFITHQRSVAKRGLCFQRRLFVSVCVRQCMCLFAR